MAALSKDILEIAKKPWFPVMMRELGYEKIIRCKDCKHRTTETYRGKEKYVCEFDSADPYEQSRNAYDDDWFCADREEKE